MKLYSQKSESNKKLALRIKESDGINTETERRHRDKLKTLGEEENIKNKRNMKECRAKKKAIKK
jgi:hypothetical protein